MTQQHRGAPQPVFTVLDTSGGPYEKVKISGELEVDSSWLMHEKLVEFIKQKGGVRLLVDVTGLHGRSSIIGTIVQADQLREERLLQAARIAVIEVPENKSSALDDEMVLSNRGLPIRYFFTEDEALRWLMDKER